jgi:hypothetical protein
MSLLRRRYKFLLLLALIAVFAVPAVAQARILACRSDPTVVLSNGTILDLSADIDTLLWNVQEVHYELHVPAGVSAILVVRTTAWLTSQETFTIVADQPAGVYSAFTTASTKDGNATVTANLLLLTALRVKLDFAAASGPERTPIFLRVDHNGFLGLLGLL